MERTAEDYGRALIAETRRRMFDESQARIQRCMNLLNQDQVWRRPNESSNSIGNLVLHLGGNIEQYIISALGGAEDRRTRQAEFDERGPVPLSDLRERFDGVMDLAREALDGLDPASLLEIRRVQGADETGISILVHVVEHLSYHTGQIGSATKALLDVDLGYYAGRDLDVTGES